ncbi:MAG: ABC transporter permease [Clostridiaceae bacterium]|jgi:ABC-2 type transport system permease protein|nr:ABC transporter permease [Clostridiaceae bacterium]
MRIVLFAKRNTKEILRDPTNLFFGLGFPLILLVLLSVINASIPAEANNTMFAIENLAPGLAMFGTAFMALFSGMLLSKDRTSSFLMRLFASPMTSLDFILGYTLPLFVMALAQAAITLFASCIAGLELTVNLLPAILMTALTSLLFVGFGLLFGSLMNEKAVGGICGALLTNVAGWLSGVFIPLDLIGGAFKKTADILPFYHGVQAIKATLSGDFAQMMPHFSIVLVYMLVVFVLAVIAFQRKMNGDKV